MSKKDKFIVLDFSLVPTKLKDEITVNYEMRIDQYFLMTDYSLWEVILNGDSPIPTRVVEGVVQPVALTSAEQKLARKNELKARGTLLMALPDKHQLKFNSHKDSKTDGGYRETHTLLWRNKADLEEQSLDDLFNSLKIYKAKVKHGSSTGTATQNLAFVSSSNTDSTTDSVSVAASVSAICAKLPVSSLPNVDSLSNAIALLTMRARRFLQKTGINLGDNGPTSMGFDRLKWSVITGTERDILLGSLESYDWSYQAEEEPANYALMDLTSSSSSSDNETNEKHGLGYFSSESDCESLNPSSLSDSSQPSGGYHAIPPPITGTFMPPKPDLVFHTALIAVETDHSAFTDCDYHAKKMTQPTPKDYAHKGNNKQNASLTYKNPPKHMVPAAVLTQSKPVSITAVRPVSTAVPKIMMTRPRLTHPIVTMSKSPITRHITRSPSPKTNNLPLRVTASQAPVVSAAQGIQGKWVWRPKCLILDHDSRTTSASMTLKWFDYNDALGRSKSVMAWVLKRI
nr:hypothetical protein [Tanacetum cinerariifolium]